MEESQCVEEQYNSESTNTEEQNSQNESDYEKAAVTSNGRLKGLLVSEKLFMILLKNFEEERAFLVIF